jgi:hypothetical protein
LIAIAAGAGYMSRVPPFDQAPLLIPGPGCFIKGNVSHNNGARIYHVPGQQYYAKTKISPLRGERWFCTEAEARQAGWRRSGV